MSAAAIQNQPEARIAEILTAARAAKEAREPESIEDRLQRLYNNDRINFEGNPKTGVCYFNVTKERGDPEALDDLIPLLTAQHTGKLKIERTEWHILQVVANRETLDQLSEEHNARVKKADHRLVDNYKEVAAKLKAADPKSSVASFIEARLADKAVTEKLIGFAQKYRRKLTVSDDIKKAKQMHFTVKDNGDAVRVDAFIDGVVNSADARSMFDIAEKVYPILFGDQIKNIETDTLSAPRRMSFDCTGELRGLFEDWKENKVEAGVNR